MFQTSKLLSVISPYVKWKLWFWIHHEQKKNITKILGFSNWEFWSKKLDLGASRKGEVSAKRPCHFGNVDFTMSNVTGVVFLIGKIKTI